MKIVKANQTLTSEALNAEMILNENVRKANEIARSVWTEIFNPVYPYKKYNKTGYNGNSYICLQNGTGKTPDSNPTYWQLIVAAGAGLTDAIQLPITDTGDYYTVDNTGDALQEIGKRIGDLTTLETESNTDLVVAVNEANNKNLQDNIIYNGNFDIWQRGVTATNLGYLEYLADMWGNVIQDYGTSPQIITSRQKSTRLLTSKYIHRVAWDGNISGQGANFRHMITQFIENGYSLYANHGEKITLKFKARSNILGKKIAVNLHERYGSTDIVNLNGKSITLTSDWQDIAYTWTPQPIVDLSLTEDDSLALQIYFAWGSNYASRFEGVNEDYRQAGFVDIAEVELTQGSAIRNVRKRTFKEELGYCKRFFQKSWDYNTLIGSATGGGWDGITCGDTNQKTIVNVTQLETEMFATPTITLYDSAGTINKITTKDADNSPTFGVTPSAGATFVGTKCFKVQHAGAVAGIGYHWVAESQLT